MDLDDEELEATKRLNGTIDYRRPKIIMFEIPEPFDVRESIFNTIILGLRKLKDIEEGNAEYVFPAVRKNDYNNTIEQIKRELDNLKGENK